MDNNELQSMGLAPIAVEAEPLTKAELEKAPIDLLAPGSTRHAKVLAYLRDRLLMSERSMTDFHKRWNVNEKQYQAYIRLPDAEEAIKAKNEKGDAPKVTAIQVPYTYASISTIVTYLIHVFAGRKPMFQLGSYKGAGEASRNMEHLLQYQADHNRLIKVLYQFLLDTQLYGVGIIRTGWKTTYRTKTVTRRIKRYGFFNMAGGVEEVKEKQKVAVYSGNEAFAQDPFMFFPDPRVPMHEVNRRGEFVFWRTFEGLHMLKKLQAQGVFKHIEAAPKTWGKGQTFNSGQSARDLRTGGTAHAGDESLRLTESYNKAMPFYKVDQGTVEIIPAELGLGESSDVEKWIFTILNDGQIVQAEPLDADHGMHPVCVSEPYTMGYSLGSLGMVDYLQPMQSILSWLLNSHIINVRTALNNMFVVDPTKIEVQDLLNPEPGKVIRMKPTALGTDVRAAISQLGVADVTSSHINDMSALSRLADTVSAITDNLRGLQDSGGRKTATEVRTAGEAGASRLAALARLISSQGIVDLAEQWTINTQQYIDPDFVVEVLGQGKTIKAAEQMFAADFYFPVHDGTLPLDKIGLLDAWREIFMAVQGDQELRQKYSLPGIFDYMAELGGVKNLEAMKINVVPDEQIQQELQAGTLAPLGDVAQGM